MKYRIGILIWAFLMGLQPLYSQKELNIDSLVTAYESQPVDTNKIKSANEIINYYMYRTPEKAGQYARELLDIAKGLNHAPGKSLAFYQLGVYHNNQDQLDSARHYYRSSLEIAEEINNGIQKSKAYRGLAIIEFSQGNLIKADSINNLDLANTIEHRDSMGIALAYDFKGTINQNKGYYSIALENVLKGLSLFEHLGDSIRIADCYNHLATLEHNLGNLEKAIDYNEKALRIYEAYEDVYYQAQALNDIGIMYMLLNQEVVAIPYYERSLEITRKHKIKSIEAATLTGFGSLYMQLKKYDKAIDYLNQSIALSKTVNAKRRIAISENKLAQAYIEIGAPARAVVHASNAKQYAEENQNISIKRPALRNLSTAYEKLNEPSLALENYKAFKVLSDSILNKEKVDKIEELRVQFDTQKKEAEIALQGEEIKTLKVQARNDRLVKSLFGIGMFSFLAISGLLYFGFTQRIKRNRIEREKQEEIYKQEIAYKKKELTSQTLHLVQKSTFIQELKENLERIKRSPELFKVEFGRLVMLLERQSVEDQDWEVFKSFFSEVHNDFDDKLRSIARDVTDKEIRLASFLRMKLTTKEIASILNVLPDSVLKSKYRLKKKLQLDKEQDLTGYLSGI